MNAADLRSLKERNLFVVALIVSCFAWLAIAASIIGLLYVPFVALAVVLGHAFFLARLTGHADYVHDVAAQESRVVVRAWIADPKVESLWSYRNPFPLSFEREIVFPAPVDSIDQERRGKKLRLKVRLRAGSA